MATKQVGGNQYNPARHPFDDYPTDPLWTQVLMQRVQFRGPVWEPAAPDGIGAVPTGAQVRYSIRVNCIACGSLRA